MFGRVRAPPSPIDSLDRPPSKILKDDSLSIFEVTLKKLREGSQRPLISPAAAELGSVADSVSATSPSCLCEMMLDAYSSSTSPYSGSDCRSKDSSGQMQDKNVPKIAHLFSKFKSHQHAASSNNGIVVLEKDGSLDLVSVSGESSCITME